MSAIVLPPLAWFGDNLLLLDELRVELERVGITQDVLLRASEHEKLERVLEHGTDRAGYPGDRRWCLDPAIAHVDVILATTPEHNREAEAEPEVSSSLKKLPLIADPMLLIYERAALEQLRDNHWRFRRPDAKSDALLAAVAIRKLALPDGWFRREEGHAYRRLVDAALLDPRATGRIVEVGCWLGRSTSYVARLCEARGATLTCVDTWAGSSDRFDAGYREVLRERDVEGEFRELLVGMGVEATIHREPSLVAAEAFADASLDLVFLDGSHDRAAVTADIASWSRRLRRGGTLAGHDFCARHPEVAAAVEAAARELGVALERGPDTLWWLQV